MGGLWGSEETNAEVLSFNLIDRVQVPADLVPGHYVLSMRFDCEETPEVWAQCGDVEVTSSGPGPTPRPSPPPAPTPSPSPTGGFCCYWPAAGDLTNCDLCTVRDPENPEQDCTPDDGNTWCPG